MPEGDEPDYVKLLDADVAKLAAALRERTATR
jgi:hypothetical protein